MMPAADMIVSGLLVGFILAFSFSQLVPLIRRERSTLSRNRVCESCGETQSLLHRLPVIDIFLKSKPCSACGHRVASTQAVLEMIIVIFTVWAFASLSFVTALEISILGFALLGAAYLDLKQWIIPNVFVVYVLLAVILGVSSGSATLQQALPGLIVGAVVSLLIILPQRFGSGERIVALGDVKLVLAVSLWLGWVLSIYVFFLSSLLALGYWVASGLISGFSVHRRVPFGPFVALSTMIFGIGRVLDPEFVTHLLTFRF